MEEEDKNFEIVLIDGEPSWDLPFVGEGLEPEIKVEVDDFEVDPLAEDEKSYIKQEEVDSYFIPEPVVHLEEMLPDDNKIRDLGKLGVSKRKINREKRHVCPMCAYATDRACNLETHIRRHTGEKPFGCDMCDYKTCDSGTLRKHKKCHFTKGTTLYKCSICGYTNTVAALFRSHFRTHSELPSYTCNECGFESNDLNTLNQHKLVHSAEHKTLSKRKGVVKIEPTTPIGNGTADFELDQKLASIAARNEITLQKIVDDNEFRCYFCKFTSSSVEDLTEHMKTHKGKKQFTCKECNFTSHDQSHLILHKKIHDSSEHKRAIYTCFDCDYNTLQAEALRKHIQIHTGEKLYECDECDFKSSDSTAFTKHEESHSRCEDENDVQSSSVVDSTSVKDEENEYMESAESSEEHDMSDEEDEAYDPSDEPPGPSEGDKRVKLSPVAWKIENGKKVFTCNDCDFKTARACNLRTHMRRHTGEKPFNCSYCDYRTGDKSTLLRHVKIHTGAVTGLRAHTCPKCNYSAIHRKYLLSHMKIHDKKSFQCNKCTYKTSVKSSLLCHLRIHSVLKPPLVSNSKK